MATLLEFILFIEKDTTKIQFIFVANKRALHLQFQKWWQKQSTDEIKFFANVVFLRSRAHVPSIKQS